MYASASSIGHHGEIIQGVFRDGEDRLHRGLVTLPFVPRHSIALARSTNSATVEIEPKHKRKALQAIEMFLERVNQDATGIHVTIKSNIPEGFGLGSSTADIVSSVGATARLLGASVKSRDLFQLAVQAETASDGIMFLKWPHLVCQREGRVLERYKWRLPRFSLLSFNAAPNDPVDTLDYTAARYSDDEIDEFQVLRALLRRAFKKQDLALLAEVATRSAIINQRHLPQPHFNEILEIVRDAKAPGLQVAHSGRMIGIILRPEWRYHSRSVQTIQRELLHLGFFPEYHGAPHPHCM